MQAADVWRMIEAAPPIDWADVFARAGSGLWLEFGVGRGDSLRMFAKENPQHHFYGFDWFKGLPEDWGVGIHCTPKGSYAQSEVPTMPENVTLVQGLFQDTLGNFLWDHPGEVSFAHLDADLYSSTRYVLDQLDARLRPGALLAFDEIIGHPVFLDHEAKALAEWWRDFHCLGRLGPNQAVFVVD